MKYFFVLGTNSALSAAELAAVMDFNEPRLLATDFLVVDSPREINAENLIKRLGGTIKIGRIEAEIKSGDDKNLEAVLRKMALARRQAGTGSKFNFGFSDYGKRAFNKKDLGLKLKKYFSEENVSSRFVISREKTLSSVVVAQNKLLKNGIEIILAGDGDNIIIGETLAVQPFKDLSLRDFGRPARDDMSGMLPPKLAQIMINLAQVDDLNAVLIDPFCGSGTVISEAVMMGYKHLFASDISAKAVEDTRRNVNWTKELYKIEEVKLKLFVKNTLDLSKFIKGDSVEAIITEPYLGPQRGLIAFKTVISNLEELYSGSLKEFHKVLQSGGRVVMIWPMFYGQRPMTPDYSGFKLLNMIPESLRESEFIKKHNRETIIYGRPGQKVYREIAVLEKI
ncbi:MAG: hypothetical protein WC719_02565 [Patescibacteria group bacterium]|jgi:tRNA G10  N-methylase Trm11